MVTKIQKWGNSQGLRLAKQVLEDAHISIGDDVDVTARDGLIVVAPVRRVRGKRSLQELISRIPKNYKTEEIDWGQPVGKEASFLDRTPDSNYYFFHRNSRCP